MNAQDARRVAWICVDCVLASGGALIPNHIATYHEDTCGVCQQMKTVTEPRDYRWPRA